MCRVYRFVLLGFPQNDIAITPPQKVVTMKDEETVRLRICCLFLVVCALSLFFGVLRSQADTLQLLPMLLRARASLALDGTRMRSRT